MNKPTEHIGSLPGVKDFGQPVVTAKELAARLPADARAADMQFSFRHTDAQTGDPQTHTARVKVVNHPDLGVKIECPSCHQYADNLRFNNAALCCSNCPKV